MGVNVFPAASGGASYSSQPPASASSVLLDGQLVTASSISTSVTGTGAPWLLYANGAGTTTITIAGTPYTVTAGSTVGTSALTGSKSVTIATTTTTPAPTTFSSSTMASSRTWYAVAYGLISSTNYYVAVSENGSSYSSYSTDGTTWTDATMVGFYYWFGITFGNGYFIAIAQFDNTISATNVSAYSTNGTTWTASTMPTTKNWGGVAYGLISSTNYYVAIANGSTVGAYSTNGTSWTSTTFSSSALTTIGFGNGYFIALGAGATSYSTNGTTWTAGSAAQNQVWNGIAYGLIGATGYYVAVGGAASSNAAVNTAMYSTNGTTWFLSTMPSTSKWQSVAYGNGYFVAIQNSSTTAAAYSSNGTTWTASTVPVSTLWGGLTYGAGKFVAVSQNSTNSAYVNVPTLINPVAYGIYNGATVRA